MKKLLSLLLVILTLFCVSSCKKQDNMHTQTFIDYFDTVCTVIGYEDDINVFNERAKRVETLLKEYHTLYDVYNSYEGVNNIHTVNQNAGISPIKVDQKIIDIIEYSKDIYDLTKHKVDITIGNLLSVWHRYRELGISDPQNASLPTIDELNEAALHKGFDKIIVDRENSTVFITDRDISIDLGAVAKGYVTERIAENLRSDGASSYALNFGGNIRVIGRKPDNSQWTSGVADPNGSVKDVVTLKLEYDSLVTSGSYLRFFTVDGIVYHHIIDPDTLYPKNDFLSVSVLTNDSGMADALSTALFCMSYDEGIKLVKSLPDTEAIWIKANGETLMSDNFSNFLIEERDS